MTAFGKSWLPPEYCSPFVLNGAANALPLNGQTTAEISDRFHVYVVPAGYVFAIWGLIYIGQLGFLLQTWRPSRLHDPLLRRIGLLPALVGLLNGVWILFWHYEIFPMTVVVMVALLVTLILLYRVAGFEQTAPLQLGPEAARNAGWCRCRSRCYLGWITVRRSPTWRPSATGQRAQPSASRRSHRRLRAWPSAS